MNRRHFLARATTALAAGAIPRIRAAAHAPTPLPDFFARFPPSTEFEPRVPMVRIATDRIIHRFFDTSPISPSGRYVGLFRLPNENRSPEPGQVGEVVLVDLATARERTVAESRGWEVQMG